MGMIGYYFQLEQTELDDILADRKKVSGVKPEKILDIDKTWDAVSFTFNSAGAEYAVPLNKESMIENAKDMPFGAFFITALQVKNTAEYLSGFSEKDFRDNYDFELMAENEIYPIVANDEPEEFLEYLLDYVEDIKKYFIDTAKNGKAMIFYIA